MKRRRETKGLKEILKQKKEAKKEVEREKQRKMALELSEIRNNTSNIHWILYNLFDFSDYYFDNNLYDYWKQNRK